MATSLLPRELRTDNIERFLAPHAAHGLLRTLASVHGKSGLSLENDPEAYAAYIRDLMSDPRARRTRMENIPVDHPDAALRLDRCRARVLTMRCASCRASAVYAMADLRDFYGASHSIAALPEILLPCPKTRNRRDGVCRVIAEPGGDAAAVTKVRTRYEGA